MSPFEILNGREPRLPSDLESIRAERDNFQARARRRDEFLQTIEKNKAEQEKRSQSKKKTDDLSKETIVPKEPTSEQRKKKQAMERREIQKQLLRMKRR
jgi:hypothetical protein